MCLVVANSRNERVWLYGRNCAGMSGVWFEGHDYANERGMLHSIPYFPLTPADAGVQGKM
jgi:hypothetical protein